MGKAEHNVNRPNLLFIQTDSQDGRVMGWTGHPAMRRATPNLDALAAGSVRFANAYTNNPVCCPARSVMWSGTYTHHCEAWNNYKGLEPDAPTFRTRFDDAGYLTQTFGKTDYLSGRHTVRARVTAWTRAACILRPAYRMPPPQVIEDDRERVHETDLADVDRSVGFLEERAAQPDRPFMLYLGIRAPHPAFTTSRRYLDLIDEAGVDVPAPDEALEHHPVFHYRKTVMPWMHGRDDHAVRTVRRIYFAMIAEVDAMVGRVLAALDDLGLTDSTWVIFTSDHGEMALEHGDWYKMCLYEPSARVPLIIRAPGGAPATVEDLVSLVDLYPTLMDIAGLTHPEELDGHSLMPLLRGAPAPRPDWVLSEFHDTPMSTGVFMLRRGHWKYVAYVGCEAQLFHLGEDPGELHNLAAERPDVAREMDGRLRAIVDYEEVDARAKAYDRDAFRAWREEERAAGTYRDTMARIYSGFDGLRDDEIMPWTDADEEQIESWLAGT